MKINNLLLEIEILKISKLLQEKVKKKKAENNRIVAKWAKTYGLTYKELHKLWDCAEKKAGKENYPLITHIFKRMVTSLKEIDGRTFTSKTGAKKDYKIRTKQYIKNFKCED